MKQALIVLGMHRSGTSSVAGALAKLGAAAPRTLMPDHPDNPKGYWESLPVVHANDRILMSAGSSWNDWRPLNPDWINSAPGKAHTEALPELISAEFGDGPLIVLKDPRLCRLFPIWSKALKTAGYAPLVLTPLRSPIEVASSLARRDGFSEARGLLMWLRHVLEAEFASRKTPRHFFHWASFISDWRTEIDKVKQSLDFFIPGMSDFTADAVDQFLDVRLRRQSLNTEVPKHAPQWVKIVWNGLQQLHDDPYDTVAQQALDDVRHEFDQTAHIYGPVFVGIETEESSWKAKHQAEVDALTARLNVTSHERDLQMTARADTEALLHQYMASTEVSEKQNKILITENKSQFQRISEAHTHLDTAKKEISKTSLQLTNHENETIKLKQTLAVLSSELEDFRIQITQLQAQNETLDQERVAAVHALTEQQGIHHALEGERDTALLEIVRLHNALEREKSHRQEDHARSKTDKLAWTQERAAGIEALAARQQVIASLEQDLNILRAAEMRRITRNPLRRFIKPTL